MGGSSPGSSLAQLSTTNWRRLVMAAWRTVTATDAWEAMLARQTGKAGLVRARLSSISACSRGAWSGTMVLASSCASWSSMAAAGGARAARDSRGGGCRGSQAGDVNAVIMLRCLGGGSVAGIEEMGATALFGDETR